MLYEVIPWWESKLARIFGRRLVNANGYCLGIMWRGKLYFQR